MQGKASAGGNLGTGWYKEGCVSVPPWASSIAKQPQLKETEMIILTQKCAKNQWFASS